MYIPSCQWNKAFPISDAEAVGVTVDHGFVGINVDVCSANWADDCSASWVVDSICIVDETEG